MTVNDSSHDDAKPKRIGYSVKRACQTLDVGRTKLFEEIEEGRLKVRYLGRKLIIPHDEIISWLAALPSRNRKGRR